MGETVGQYLTRLLEKRELSQNELSRRSGVPQPTISHIANDKHQTTLQTYKRLADALDVDVSEFVRRALGQPVEEDADQAEPLTSAAARERLVSLTGETETDHRTLIVEGDREGNTGNWRGAVLKYATAYPLLRKTRDRIIFLIHSLARTYMNLGAYNLAALLLNRAENLLIKLQPDPDDFDALSAAVYENRGWVEGYRGNFDLARALFLAARKPADRAGEEDRVSTTHHFSGRLVIESQMVALFDRLPLPPPPGVAVDLALEELATARRMQAERPPNTAFNLLWEGRGLRLAGDWEGAQDYIAHSLYIFHTVKSEVAEAQSIIELARQPVLRGADAELGDAEDQLRDAIWVNLAGTQHPYTVARGFTLLAYLELLRDQYRTASRLRHEIADMCELVQRIHPHPEHPLYRIAQTIQGLAMDAMDERERTTYEGELEARTAPEARNDHPLFYWLDNYLPTSEKYIIHKQVVNVLIEFPA